MDGFSRSTGRPDDTRVPNNDQEQEFSQYYMGTTTSNELPQISFGEDGQAWGLDPTDIPEEYHIEDGLAYKEFANAHDSDVELGNFDAMHPPSLCVAGDSHSISGAEDAQFQPNREIPHTAMTQTEISHSPAPTGYGGNASYMFSNDPNFDATSLPIPSYTPNNVQPGFVAINQVVPYQGQMTQHAPIPLPPVQHLDQGTVYSPIPGLSERRDSYHQSDPIEAIYRSDSLIPSQYASQAVSVDAGVIGMGRALPVPHALALAQPQGNFSYAAPNAAYNLPLPSHLPTSTYYDDVSRPSIYTMNALQQVQDGAAVSGSSDRIGHHGINSSRKKSSKEATNKTTEKTPWYDPFEKVLAENFQDRPRAFGLPTPSSSHTFNYGDYGQLEARKKYITQQIREYVNQKVSNESPLHIVGGEPSDSQSIKRFAMWIQSAPAQCKDRLGPDDNECRWDQCLEGKNKAGKNCRNGIRSGWLRVAMDEYPQLTTIGLLDALKPAGVLHLYCFERIFSRSRIVELYRKGFLRIDNRPAFAAQAAEEKNFASIVRDSGSGVVDEALKWFDKKPLIPEHVPEKNLPINEGWKDPLNLSHDEGAGWKWHCGSLSAAITRFHVGIKEEPENEGTKEDKPENKGTRQRKRDEQNLNLPDDCKKTLDFHLGSLHAERERAMRRKSWDKGVDGKFRAEERSRAGKKYEDPAKTQATAETGRRGAVETTKRTRTKQSQRRGRKTAKESTVSTDTPDRSVERSVSGPRRAREREVYQTTPTPSIQPNARISMEPTGRYGALPPGDFDPLPPYADFPSITEHFYLQSNPRMRPAAPMANMQPSEMLLPPMSTMPSHVSTPEPMIRRPLVDTCADNSQLPFDAYAEPRGKKRPRNRNQDDGLPEKRMRH